MINFRCRVKHKAFIITGRVASFPPKWQPPDLPGVLKSLDLVCGRCRGVPTFIIDMLHPQRWPKTPFLQVFSTFFKNGSLGFAHIRSECSPDLYRAPCAIGSDASFWWGLIWTFVRCACGNSLSLGLNCKFCMHFIQRDHSIFWTPSSLSVTLT